MTEAGLRPICCRELYSNGEYVLASFNGIFYHISTGLTTWTCCQQHSCTNWSSQKVGGPHPYIDPAPEKWGVNWPPGPRGSAAPGSYPGGVDVLSNALHSSPHQHGWTRSKWTVCASNSTEIPPLLQDLRVLKQCEYQLPVTKIEEIK